MKSGICPNCVKTIKIDESEVLGICPFCGEPYEVSKAVFITNEIPKQASQKVEVTPLAPQPIEVAPEPSLEQAESLLNSGNFDKAFTMYETLSSEQQDNYLIWLGLARSISHEFTKIENGKRYFRFMSKAKQFAPDYALDEFLLEDKIYIKRVEQYELGTDAPAQTPNHTFQFTSNISWIKIIPLIALIGFIVTFIFSLTNYLSVTFSGNGETETLLTIGITQIFQVLTGEQLLINMIGDTNVTAIAVSLSLLVMGFWVVLIIFFVKTLLDYAKQDELLAKRAIKYQIISAIYGSVLFAIYLGTRIYVNSQIVSYFGDDTLTTVSAILAFLDVEMTVYSSTVPVLIVVWLAFAVSMITRKMMAPVNTSPTEEGVLL